MSNSLSIQLHNVFDRIERTDELTLTRPMLEVVSPEAHADVQLVEERRSPQTSQEVLEKLVVIDVTKSHLDGVDHNHMSQREMKESPNGSAARATHSSPLGREDIQPMGEVQMIQTSTEEEEIPTVDDVSEPLQDGVEHDHVSPRELEKSPKGARESVPSPSPVEHADVMAGMQLMKPPTAIESHDVGGGLPLHEVAVLQQQ
jgi:hypothetical protein